MQKDIETIIVGGKEMDDLDRYIQKRCERDPEFKKAWEESDTEVEMTISLVEARNAANMTQQDLAKATGIDQGSLSRIECGEGNPTIGKLKRIAKGMNADLRILFVPKDR